MAKYRTGEHFSFSFTLSESGIWIDPRILSPRDYHLFMQKDHLTSVLFSSLGLSDPLLESLEDAGFIHCTPIQAATLPLALQGQDIAGQAQTGTGKTAAFLLATLHYLMETPAADDAVGPWAMILAPTRELAVQIHRDAELIGRYTGLRFAAVYGGTGYDSQRRQLESGVDVLIGTPGRLIDYFKQGVYRLSDIEVVVLDEADRMFDLGFIADIRYLLRKMPPPGQRINMLFSATLSNRVMELAYEHMNDPQVIRIETEYVTADKVRQSLYHVSAHDKISLLLGVLHQQDPKRTMIFVNTKRAADRVSGYLLGNGYEAEVLSGDIPQNKRLRLLESFQRGELPILVATDVAARGLHIPDVTHVINFDLPQDREDYVHRIGRTARIGASGDAISFACEEYVYSLPEIEDFIGQKIPTLPVSEELLLEYKPAKRLERRRPPFSGGEHRPRGRTPHRRPANRT
ncbi:putative ATP-dependent helicase with nucleoside triP hydrolase domain [Candidatus Competibacter denitrificans Run_A_D11]|uniref:ATP-dependent RNA helicase RhlB n=2 Tax=Candidatus Competibacter TaxID=221279 RepID=W6MBW1_9GAMM|nr:putative ATP-dependent helicase with nucleoside triP hydrolase domain [Candidatus Competibacter denitrificans Run_A_D11]